MPDLFQRTQPLRRYLKFHGLMPFRVPEILLLSSVYDAFTLEEDGPLTDQLFSGYFELNLSQTPRITHVTNSVEARRLLTLAVRILTPEQLAALYLHLQGESREAIAESLGLSDGKKAHDLLRAGIMRLRRATEEDGENS